MEQTGPLNVHTGGAETPVSPDFRWPGGKRIADAGREVAAHSCTMDLMSGYMSEEEERADRWQRTCARYSRSATGDRQAGRLFHPRPTTHNPRFFEGSLKCNS